MAFAVTVMCSMLLSLVVTGLRMNNAESIRSAISRDTRQLDVLLAADVSGSTTCGLGTTSPLQHLSSHEASWFVRQENPVWGVRTVLVRYRQVDSTLTRHVVAVGSDCSALTGHANEGERVIVSGMRSASATKPVFVPSAGSDALEGTCDRDTTTSSGTVTATLTGSACSATAIGIDARVAPHGPDGTQDRFKSTYLFQQAGAQ